MLKLCSRDWQKWTKQIWKKKLKQNYDIRHTLRITHKQSTNRIVQKNINKVNCKLNTIARCCFTYALKADGSEWALRAHIETQTESHSNHPNCALAWFSRIFSLHSVFFPLLLILGGHCIPMCMAGDVSFLPCIEHRTNSNIPIYFFIYFLLFCFTFPLGIFMSQDTGLLFVTAKKKLKKKWNGTKMKLEDSKEEEK